MNNKKQPHVVRKRPFKKGWLKNGNPPCDLSTLPQCKAKAKGTGKRCGNRAMKGKRVCYIHGGKSPGASKGNKCALKHGRYTAKAKKQRRKEKELVRSTEELIDELKQQYLDYALSKAGF